MNYYGECHCGSVRVTVETDIDFTQLTPRRCDCKSCQSLQLPAAMVSDPGLKITIENARADLHTKTNGSGQAIFYHCGNCAQLIAVGARLAGGELGAVNSFLFSGTRFCEPVAIQPRLLSPDEKVQRWLSLWGRLEVNGCHHEQISC